MTHNGYPGGEPEAVLPPIPEDIQELIDGLDQLSFTEDVAPWLSANLKLTYVSPPGKPDTLRSVEGRLRGVMNEYRASVDAFVRIGHGTDEQRPNIPDKSSYAPHELVVPRYERRGWLQTVSEHDPGFVSGEMRDLVDVIADGYVEFVFENTLEVAMDAPHREGARAAAGRLAYDTARDLMRFSTDPASIRKFMASEFYGRYGNETLSAWLRERLVRLEYADAPYALLEMAASVNKLLIGENAINPGDIRGPIETIAQISPRLIDNITTGMDPARSNEVLSLAAAGMLHMEAEALTPVHDEVLHGIERHFIEVKDVTAYSALAIRYAHRDGAVSPYRLSCLYGIVRAPQTSSGQEVDRGALDRAALLIAEHAPHDWLMDLSKDMRIKRSDQVVATIIRRLSEYAAEGPQTDAPRATALALQLAHDQFTQSLQARGAARRRDVDNYMAIYERTGLPGALETAQILAEDAGIFAQHEAAIRWFIVARRKNNPREMVDAINGIARGHEHDDRNIRVGTLRTTTHYLLQEYTEHPESDINLNDAIDCARQATAQPPMEGGAPERYDDRQRAMLAVIYTLTRAGRLSDAVALAREFYLNQEQINTHGYDALGIIASRGQGVRWFAASDVRGGNIY